MIHGTQSNPELRGLTWTDLKTLLFFVANSRLIFWQYCSLFFHLGGPPDTSHLNTPLVARLTVSRMRRVGAARGLTLTPSSG